MSWLPLGPGPDPAWLAARVAWWQAREAALLAHAPLDVEPPDLVLSAEEHAQAEAWLPLEPLREDLEDALAGWFDLSGLGMGLGASDLARWRSWLDARARLPLVRGSFFPSALLSALEESAFAHDLLFELCAPPVMGSELGRYGARLTELAALAPAAEALVAWDVGCGTGEGTWELAYALAPRARQVDAVGTTPCPLQRLMAERRDRPHDPARGAALRAFVDAGPRERCDARFVRHDLLRDPPPGAFHAIACHGLLGESVDEPVDIERAVTSLARVLLPGAVLSVTDRFRADRAARAAAIVERVARSAGLEVLGAGLFRRP